MCREEENRPPRIREHGALPLPFQGLSAEEVHERLSTDGYNEIPAGPKRSLFRVLSGIVREPMFALLLVCGLVYLMLGDPAEAVMLLGFVVVIIGITLYQEQKTERALDALRKMSSPRALVIRDGVEKRISGREVVRGDLLVLAEGDRVAADAVLIHGGVLQVDESLLTGESVPVRKVPRQDVHEMAPPGGDGQPCLYSGTLVVRGKGIARVVETGVRTSIGKIGRVLTPLESQDTQLKRQTAKLVRLLFGLGLVLCLLIAVVYAMTRDGWLNGVLAGLTLAMAVIPEEFPVVLSVFLALGAWRISKRNVLTRRAPAVEALGAATVLCVDKTGTLTQNQMTVSKIALRDRILDLRSPIAVDLPEAFHEIVEFSILASRVDPFDPMEKAFRKFGDEYLANTEHLHSDWVLEQEYPLSEELLAMSHVWRSPARQEYVIAAKGAPEAIADLCHFDDEQTERLSENVGALANEGLRVLAIAKASFRKTDMPDQQHDFHFDFLGLVGLADPVRPAVRESVRQCREAGVRVVMITGDYPATAQDVAAQIDLQPRHRTMTGPDVNRLSDEELAQQVGDTDIFARMAPEQKLRLVEALKSRGEVVAMTGDGVNDAPALRAADIGIAMDSRGTDVAREAADLVLLDDDFSSIVEAVRLGRRIFDNIQKAIAYILAIHVPVAGLSLIPVVLKWPLMLLPVHIVFLELIIDPACSIVFEVEMEEDAIMRRPPRPHAAPLVSRRMLALSLLQGLGILALVLCVFAWGLKQYSDEEARTVAFVSLILANFTLIIVNRSWSRNIWNILRTRNPAMWWVIGCGMAFLALVLYTPLHTVFHLAPLHWNDTTIPALAALAGLAWSEGIRRATQRFAARSDSR